MCADIFYFVVITAYFFLLQNGVVLMEDTVHYTRRYLRRKVQPACGPSFMVEGCEVIGKTASSQLRAQIFTSVE